MDEVFVSLNGNTRTRRPSFSQLNSNDLYVNRFLAEKGNPYLQKENYYEINSNILYKIFSINIGYSYIKNPMSFYMLQNGSSQANSILTFTNYDKFQQISAVASVDYKISGWRPKLTLGIMQPFFSSSCHNECNNLPITLLPDLETESATYTPYDLSDLRLNDHSKPEDSCFFR